MVKNMNKRPAGGFRGSKNLGDSTKESEMQIKDLVDCMDKALTKDIESNKNGKMAIERFKILKKIDQVLHNPKLRDSFME